MAENKKTWTQENLERRVEFSLQTAFAFGVRAMRSHVDFAPDTPEFVWKIMGRAADNWQGRIDLQLSPLAAVSRFEEPEYCKNIYAVSAQHGRIGLFLFDHPNLQQVLTPIFEHANAQSWDIDLHVDEGLVPTLDGLNSVIEVALATRFGGTILCGHCVALNSYQADRRETTIKRAVEAGLHFAALPTTNLYLQGRTPDNSPQIRGMAPVAKLAAAGATVSLGADNVRDGFCAFGDFDPMAVLNLGAQIGHLHEPARDWSALVTSNPASTLGLRWDGIIKPGAPADLVLFAARNSGEMSTRATPQRQVIRAGEWLDISAPDFRELN